MKILSSDPDILAVLGLEAYCGRLGHFVPFRYCLHPAEETPCFKILDCWWQTFDVISFLQRNLSQESFSQIAQRSTTPGSRVEGILRILSDLEGGGG